MVHLHNSFNGLFPPRDSLYHDLVRALRFLRALSWHHQRLVDLWRCHRLPHLGIWGLIESILNSCISDVRSDYVRNQVVCSHGLLRKHIEHYMPGIGLRSFHYWCIYLHFLSLLLCTSRTSHRMVKQLSMVTQLAARARGGLEPAGLWSPWVTCSATFPDLSFLWRVPLLPGPVGLVISTPVFLPCTKEKQNLHRVLQETLLAW